MKLRNLELKDGLFMLVTQGFRRLWNREMVV